MAKQREYNFLIYISRIYKICSPRKHSPPAPTMDSSFALDPHLLEFPWRCLSSPPPSQISVICQLGWVLWKEQFHQKCDKMRKNLTIHVNTVSNNLKDFLS